MIVARLLFVTVSPFLLPLLTFRVYREGHLLRRIARRFALNQPHTYKNIVSLFRKQRRNPESPRCRAFHR